MPSPFTTPPPPPPPGFEAPPSRVKKRTLAWAIVGIMVVTTVAFALALALFRDDDTGSAPERVDDAAAAVARLVADANPDVDSAETLDGCVVPLTVLAATAPDGVDIAAFLAEDAFSAVIRSAEDDIVFIECSVQLESGLLVGVSVGPRPAGDYMDAMRTYLVNFDVTPGATASHRGGTLVDYCGTAHADAEGYASFCETDWYTDDLVVGIFVSEEVASKEQVHGWVVAALDDLVQRTADTSAAHIGTSS